MDAALCEKVRPSGDTCGVQAVGRCRKCEEAVCESHRALGDYQRPVVDLCRECLDADAEARRLAWLEAQKCSRAYSPDPSDPVMNTVQFVEWLGGPNFPDLRLESMPSVAVASALLAAGVCQRGSRVKGLFGRSRVMDSGGWLITRWRTGGDDRHEWGEMRVLMTDGRIAHFSYYDLGSSDCGSEAPRLLTAEEISGIRNLSRLRPT